MALKKSRLFGGEVIVQEYEVDDDILTCRELNVLVFDSPSSEWAEFIYKNRNRESRYNHNYDIIIGPIANDGVAYLLGRYEEGTLTLDELSRELTFKKLNNQYFFGTEKSLKYLCRI